jgi:RNAse (barnase) inhibitor barstar
LAVCPEKRFSSFLASFADANSGTATPIIRGAHCATSTDFFNELAAALKFPPYFGHNWDAFNDCINDLEWLPAKHYVIGISRADSLLIRNEERLATLIDILGRAAEAWPSYEADRDWTRTWVTMDDGTTQWAQRPTASFHVVFQSQVDDPASIRNRFHGVGLDLASIEIPARPSDS